MVCSASIVDDFNIMLFNFFFAGSSSLLEDSSFSKIAWSHFSLVALFFFLFADRVASTDVSISVSVSSLSFPSLDCEDADGIYHFLEEWCDCSWGGSSVINL